MVNTNPVPINRDDPEARRQSVRFQWGALQQLFPTLPNFVALGTITNANQYRNSARDTLRIQRHLENRFEENNQDVIRSEPGNPARSTVRSAANAEAWLKTIYEIIEGQDVRAMLLRTPAAILRADGRNIWQPRNPAGGLVQLNFATGPTIDVTEIDLSNPVWQGNEVQVRNALRRMTPQQSGITLAAPTNEVLDEANINLLLASVDDVIDPNQTQVAGAAAATTQVSLTTAVNNRAAVTNLARGASSREVMMALATLQRDPGALLALQTTNEEQNRLENELRENQRLLRAATAVSSLANIQLTNFDESHINLARTAATDVIARASAGIGVPNGTPVDLIPPGLHPEIAAQLNTIVPRNPITRRNVAALVNPRTGAITTPAVDNTAEFENIIQQARVILDRYQQAEEKNEETERALNEMINVLGDRGIDVTRIAGANYPNLHRFITDARPVPAGSPPGTNPAAGVNAVPTAYAVQSNQIRRDRISLPAIGREFRSVLAREGNQRVALQDVSFYENREREIVARLPEVINSAEAPPQGSDACWRVIERGISHLENIPEGPELDRIINVTRTISDRTDETRRHIEELTRRSIAPYQGAARQDAINDWNGSESRNFNSITTHPAEAAAIAGVAASAGAAGLSAGLLVGGTFWPAALTVAGAAGGGYLTYRMLRNHMDHSAWRDYENNLFDDRHIGIRLNENPMQRRFPLNRVVDAYFQTKYLLEKAPEHLRLPQSQEMYQYLARLQRAIRDRAQEGYYNQLGINRRDEQHLLTNEDGTRRPAPDAIQRITSASEILNLEDEYHNELGDQTTRMATDAYRPVQNLADRRERMRRVGQKVAAGVGAVKNVVRDSAKSGLSKLGKGGGYVWNRKAKIAGWAAIGTLVMPGLGTAAGAALATMFASPDKAAA